MWHDCEEPLRCAEEKNMMRFISPRGCHVDYRSFIIYQLRLQLTAEASGSVFGRVAFYHFNAGTVLFQCSGFLDNVTRPRAWLKVKATLVVAALWRSGFLQNFRRVVTNDQMFNKGGGYIRSVKRLE